MKIKRRVARWLYQIAKVKKKGKREGGRKINGNKNEVREKKQIKHRSLGIGRKKKALRHRNEARKRERNAIYQHAEAAVAPTTSFWSLASSPSPPKYHEENSRGKELTLSVEKRRVYFQMGAKGFKEVN